MMEELLQAAHTIFRTDFFFNFVCPRSTFEHIQICVLNVFRLNKYKCEYTRTCKYIADQLFVFSLLNVVGYRINLFRKKLL